MKSAYQTIWSCGMEAAIPNPFLKRPGNQADGGASCSPTIDEGGTLQQDRVHIFSQHNLGTQPGENFALLHRHNAVHLHCIIG